jgi:hypothetical protein
MDYKHMTAPCGLDCFNCPMHLAGEDERLRAAVARNMNLPVEKVVCRGCRDENGTIGFAGMTEPCNVFKCITKKGISLCSECGDFPCYHLHPYADKASERPHNAKVFNLSLIKKMGIEAWAKTKAKSVRDTYYKGKFKL